MTRRASTDTPQIIMGAIGGVVTGYILWLAAISVGDGLTTVSQWSRVVLLLSVLVAVCGAAGGFGCAAAASSRGRRLLSVCRFLPWC
ncbi:Conserved membrane protein of uncharacterised function [Mycobacterium tuberculosis]|nr:Conserved membrane protein of uncharacterised function [Mycobacterium tuberculosis]